MIAVPTWRAQDADDDGMLAVHDQCTQWKGLAGHFVTARARNPLEYPILDRVVNELADAFGGCAAKDICLDHVVHEQIEGDKHITLLDGVGQLDEAFPLLAILAARIVAGAEGTWRRDLDVGQIRPINQTDRDDAASFLPGYVLQRRRDDYLGRVDQRPVQVEDDRLEHRATVVRRPLRRCAIENRPRPGCTIRSLRGRCMSRPRAGLPGSIERT